MNTKKSKGPPHWTEKILREVRTRFPETKLFTTAAGISPSGVVHFGNFRDVMTSLMVYRALQAEGLHTRLLFSWDDYDRFRKVPAGVDPAFEQHIGKPLTAVPDPSGEHESYARSFQVEFERSMQELDIELDYKYQSQLYASGAYVEEIKRALLARKEIAEVLLSFMSEKGKQKKGIRDDEYKANYYPAAVYSTFTGKDSTEILGYDGAYGLTYRCLETKEEESIDFREQRIVKLNWKIDWPMRWGVEGVVFEPGGKDHASPGGSYDVSRVLSEKVFDRPAPVFQGYDFIGLKGLGGKMSGSKGGAVSPATLLRIYGPEILKWQYTRKQPNQVFDLAFDSEVMRQYDEFDREHGRYHRGKLPTAAEKSLEMCYADSKPKDFGDTPPIPFRQAVAFGQIVQWNKEKLLELLDEQGSRFDTESVSKRLKSARSWLEDYNPEDIIELLKAPNEEYFRELSEASKSHVRELHRFLSASEPQSIKEIEERVYAIPKDPALDQKENAPRQRAFFTDVYKLLIGEDTGPRLSTFLWAVDRNQALHLLSL